MPLGPISSQKLRDRWNVVGMRREWFGRVNECTSCELMSGMVIGIISTADKRVEDGDRADAYPTFHDSCSHGAIKSRNTYAEKLTVMFSEEVFMAVGFGVPKSC